MSFLPQKSCLSPINTLWAWTPSATSSNTVSCINSTPFRLREGRLRGRRHPNAAVHLRPSSFPRLRQEEARHLRAHPHEELPLQVFLLSQHRRAHSPRHVLLRPIRLATPLAVHPAAHRQAEGGPAPRHPAPDPAALGSPGLPVRLRQEPPVPTALRPPELQLRPAHRTHEAH